ncbi:MAG: hypothetical protein WC926_00510 [Candidatus Paceibacterota bacterium]|jgi:hypothetical protein
MDKNIFKSQRGSVNGFLDFIFVVVVVFLAIILFTQYDYVAGVFQKIFSQSF